MPAHVRLLPPRHTTSAHDTVSMDDPQFDQLEQAEDWLRTRNLVYVRCTDSHLKISMGYGPDLNFWPIGKGTLYFDGAPRRETERGLVGLETLLKRKGLLK